ncbi:ABC transporter ATP-binding protein [Bauldia litoralis]|uniref:Multiple sugar transport system ATP-binding protein n=1 Tax=Bauldia litoralis TaxID=665467 RepID=A0A1G6DYE0_9HYPH|nr:ATP-binding cassette domain-containing protein [Bauldia litoralis]SDB50132.1 multiple sugar transport system ATP-binding protein [Bauldia litoralis]
MPQVELRNISKSFGSVTVCHDVNLIIEDRAFVTLLGPSGCGKTTTLNMLAGLEDPSAGDILMDGQRVNERSPVDRDVAMVFQNYALYPHMTVAENIGFTLRMRHMGRGEIRRRVEEVARSLELGPLLDRLPAQLSGGQQQRVAIGRALVREPRVFLFDEPFSNLDASLRIRMRAEVKELHQRLGVTSIFVTHDQEEAMSISDQIAVMSKGRIEQFGTPEEVYARPATRTVAAFIGNPQIDLASGRVEHGADGLICRVGEAELALPAGTEAVAGQAVEVGVRSEHVQLSDTGAAARVRLVQPVGPATHVTLDWAGGTLTATLPGIARLAAGSATAFAIAPENLLVFDPDSGKRIGGRTDA